MHLPIHYQLNVHQRHFQSYFSNQGLAVNCGCLTLTRDGANSANQHESSCTAEKFATLPGSRFSALPAAGVTAAASLLARLPIFAAGAAAAPSAATGPSAAPCQCCRSVFLSCSCQNKVKIPPLAWIGRIDQIVSKLWGKIGYACGLK